MVTQCGVDYGFTLVIMDGNDSLEVRIEQRFELALPSGTVRFDPAGDPTMIGPALAVLHAAVNEVIAFENGRLVVSFADGRELCVPPNEDYEPWTLVGPDGLRIVSMPGGELAIWKPDPA